MLPFDRQVRAQVYRHLVASRLGPTKENLAEQRGWSAEEVGESLERLHRDHFLALTQDRSRVMMAHPFSGVGTAFEAHVGSRSWFANCAWDALAILALLGDGVATQSREGNELVWEVSDGRVTPGGVIHVEIPARHFWDDIGFT